MAKINDLIKELEILAPVETTEKWDNSGWQLKLEKEEINKVMIALSPTKDVIDQAIKENADMLVCHHPMIFSKLTKLNCENYVQASIIKAIKADLPIYSLHTNLDKAEGGVSDIMAERLGLLNIERINDFCRKGEYSEESSLDDLLLRLKLLFNAQKIKLVNPKSTQTLKTVTVCAGSGGEFIPEITTDVFVTADIKYHQALEVENFIVIDIGHYESEQPVLTKLAEVVENCGIETVIAREKNPWIIV